MKKLLSLLLCVFIFNMTYLPVFASDDISSDVLPVSFVSDLNVNKSSKRQVVQFRLDEDYTDSNGYKIPSGTIFEGKIKSIKHSRWAFRRAKAHILINKMTLPTGQTCKVKAFTKPRTIKGSALGNVGKAIGMTPISIVVGVAGLVVVAVEAITIVGLPLVAPTGATFCGILGKTTKGVNCYKSAGTAIDIKFKRSPQTEEIPSEAYTSAVDDQHAKVDDQNTTSNDAGAPEN